MTWLNEIKDRIDEIESILKESGDADGQISSALAILKNVVEEVEYNYSLLN